MKAELTLGDIFSDSGAAGGLADGHDPYRQLIERMPAAIYVKDLAGRYTLANPLACRALGRPEGVSGLTDHDLLPREVADLLHQHDVEVIESGSTIEYEEVVERNGFTAAYLSVKFPLISAAGDVIGVCGVSTDITARKSAENARRESEERFTRFMQHLPGLAWIKDAAGRYVFANETASKAFQTKLADLYGRRDDQLFPPEIAAQFHENDELAFASEQGIQTVESLAQSDGITHYSLVNKFPIPDSSGVPTWIGGMAIDVTERRRAGRSPSFPGRDCRVVERRDREHHPGRKNHFLERGRGADVRLSGRRGDRTLDHDLHSARAPSGRRGNPQSLAAGRASRTLRGGPPD